MTFYRLSKLVLLSQTLCKFMAFSLEFQKIFLITRTIFSHSRSEQFGNKIPLLFHDFSFKHFCHMQLSLSFLKWNLILTLSQFLGDKYWKNPEKFDPNRFFDTNGKLNIPEAFIPFGLGMLFDNITA